MFACLEDLDADQPNDLNRWRLQTLQFLLSRGLIQARDLEEARLAMQGLGGQTLPMHRTVLSYFIGQDRLPMRKRSWQKTSALQAIRWILETVYTLKVPFPSLSDLKRAAFV